MIARLNVGGPARHVLWLTKGLDNDRFRSRLIAGTVPPGEEDMAYLAEQLEVKPAYIREMSRELSSRDIISLFKIYREMRRFSPDVVHTHTAKAGTVGRVAAFVYRWLTPGTLIGRPRPLRVVHTFHGHVFHSYYGQAKTRLFLFIERMLARFATDRIIVISQQQFEEINGTFRVGRPEQFEIVPLGIDLDPFKKVPSPQPLSERGLVIAFVGRLTEIKNIPMLLKAAAKYKELDAETPAPRLLIAGSGSLRESLERTVLDLTLNENVTFLGNVEDTSAVYADCDVVALTSLNEGTPLSLIEAMAAGRPVIATTVGGVADLLGQIIEEKDGFDIHERGIGVASGNVAGFANGLRYLAKNERLRETLADNARAFVIENYSKDRLINDISRLYDSLAEI